MGIRGPGLLERHPGDIPDRPVEALALWRVKGRGRRDGPGVRPLLRHAHLRLRGGCLTGPNHSGVELHGFLSYLIKCNLTGAKYKVYGYKGKQVRDNIHSLDVARFIAAFIASPRAGEVYNIGGGRGNSCSILEAFAKIAAISGKPMVYEYVDQNRVGDHICYISDLRKMKAHYPGWDISKSLDDIFQEITLRGQTANSLPV